MQRRKRRWYKGRDIKGNERRRNGRGDEKEKKQEREDVKRMKTKG